MALKLRDVVSLGIERLFNGAVNLDWFLTDAEKKRLAAESFVFHGPKYHGVTQDEIGHSHGHQLQDTATFTRAVLRRCFGQEDQPFTLAIAGYGTGKSHIALTLAALLSEEGGSVREPILKNLDMADNTIGAEVRAILAEQRQPCLVMALNGMRSFDLTAELTRQAMIQIGSKGVDASALNQLRPRFSQASSLINMSSEDVSSELLASLGTDTVEPVLEALTHQDEVTYAKVHDFFSARGMPIRSLGGESARDLIEVVCREYCGKGKPFARMVILFDEFGRYTEFATIRSQIAGSGVLQDLFEGIQANSEKACLVGFIQFELNAYVQRIAPEFRNDILRYVTRYQSAKKSYLSINLETLIAHLIDRKRPEVVDSWLDSDTAREDSQEILEDLNRWFPQSTNLRLWTDTERFHTVIRKGCWPLSPYATWLLFYLAAAGKHLQERSALTLLGDAFLRHAKRALPAEGMLSLAPTDLWSAELEQELLSAEESGQQGSITHSFVTVQDRHGTQLGHELVQLLRAAVLSAKLGLQASDRADAVEGLAVIAGLSSRRASNGVKKLQGEYNVLEWDDSFKQFDILGDAVPRTQFLSFVRRRVASNYDDTGKAKLFASNAAEWCDLLGDLECDFAESNSITTREWRYLGATSNLELLLTHLKFAADRWKNALGVDEPRGTVIYCYVGQQQDLKGVTADATKLLRAVTRETGVNALPILIVFLYDEDGKLGQALAELAVLGESITEHDRARFGNLIGAHKEKMRHVVQTRVESMIMARRYVAAVRGELQAKRLGRVGSELFGLAYKKPIPFPFDGFSTARGNAADTCQQLTTELLRGSLDFDSVISMAVKTKNRAVTVLKETWQVFTRTGAVSRRPAHPYIRAVTQNWDKALQEGERRLSLGEAVRELCLPPYGANIASAGLLLGVFIAPRSENLMVVRDGEQYAVSQWVQDGLFTRKFLDRAKLDGVELVSVGEVSSEWQALLDEWEDAESYSARGDCMRRARELKQRVPVPPTLGYRFVHLQERGEEAVAAIEKMEEAQNEALMRIEQGMERSDAGGLAWGGAGLVKLCTRMESDALLWTDSQLREMQPHIERARQAVIQMFPVWLKRQAPASGSPSGVGDWKHKMVRLTGGNLKTLTLDDLYEALEQHVSFLLRNVETAAEASQLMRDVASYLAQNRDACRIVRVAELRGLKDVGREFSNRSQGMARRIDLAELSETRTQLADFLRQMKDAESAAMKRASKLWDAKVRSEEDLVNLLSEVEDLTRMFEGCTIDLQDLRLLSRGLKAYQHCYSELKEDHLTWPAFESLSATLEEQMCKEFAEGQLPWAINETLGHLVKRIARSRKESGKAWIEDLESESKALQEMSTVDASRLHERASRPPACLTEVQSKCCARILRKFEQHLNALAVEWLLQKFRELPSSSRKEFLRLAEKAISD